MLHFPRRGMSSFEGRKEVEYHKDIPNLKSLKTIKEEEDNKGPTEMVKLSEASELNDNSIDDFDRDNPIIQLNLEFPEWANTQLSRYEKDRERSQLKSEEVLNFDENQEETHSEFGSAETYSENHQKVYE